MDRTRVAYASVQVLQRRHVVRILTDFVEKPTDSARRAGRLFSVEAPSSAGELTKPGLRHEGSRAEDECDAELYAIRIVRRLIARQTVSHSARCTCGFVQKRPFPKSVVGGRPLAFSRYLIAFFVGVVATVAWQCYGGATREIVTPPLPSAYQHQLTAMSLDIDAVRQNVDRMVTNFAVGQNQMTRTINQLRVGQDWMASDFAAKLKAVELDILDRTSTPAARPASAPVSKPVLRSAHIAATR